MTHRYCCQFKRCVPIPIVGIGINPPTRKASIIKRNMVPKPEVCSAILKTGNICPFLVYLHIQQLLPLNRITEMIHALTGHTVSEGTIIRANQELHAKLEPEEQKIKTHLLEAAVLHSDESGVQVNKKRLWLHTACTPLFTYYMVHKNRGKKAINEAGLIPVYKGTNMHDGLKVYNGYNCKQALCNEHHHRELNAVIENDKQPWVKGMIDLLYEIKKEKRRPHTSGT